MKDPIVLTVDLGFAKKGRNLAAELDVPIAFIEKRRSSSNTSAEALTLIGDAADRDVIIVDDEVDTGGSMCEAAHLAKEQGSPGYLHLLRTPGVLGPRPSKGCPARPSIT